MPYRELGKPRTKRSGVRGRMSLCQGRCCRKDGSKKVLTAFESQPKPSFNIIACGCLGQCGNGPNVFILPKKVWYQRVSTQDVSSILSQS